MWFVHFRRWQHAISQYRYTNAELAAIHSIKYLAYKNGRAFFQFHGEKWRTSVQPNRQTYPRVHQNLAKHESLRATIEISGMPRTARTSMLEEGMLRAKSQNPGTSVRTLAIATGRSRTTVLRVLQSEILTGRNLFMENLHVTIWTEHFQTGGLDFLSPSLGFLDPMIYLRWIFSQGSELCPNCLYVSLSW